MEDYFSTEEINSYIDFLINQCFSILPFYEENGLCFDLTQKIESLFRRINGFFKLNTFNSNITIDILSFINTLKDSDNHKDVRSNVLKICSLLTNLKDGD